MQVIYKRLKPSFENQTEINWQYYQKQLRREACRPSRMNNSTSGQTWFEPEALKFYSQLVKNGNLAI